MKQKEMAIYKAVSFLQLTQNVVLFYQKNKI